MNSYRKAPSPWHQVKFHVLIIVALAILIFTVDLFAQNGVRNIHRERSLYRNILVTEDSAAVCALLFPAEVVRTKAAVLWIIQWRWCFLTPKWLCLVYW